VSDLVSNATRGRLAEFIVATALGVVKGQVRDEWSAFDLTSPSGVKIEVKSAAYLQSWHQHRLSAITWSVRRTREWDADTNLQSKESRRQADVYVFALLAHRDKGTLDPLNVRQWKFFVVPTQTLDARERSQHSITLLSLEALAGPGVAYDELASAVEKSAQSGRKEVLTDGRKTRRRTPPSWQSEPERGWLAAPPRDVHQKSRRLEEGAAVRHLVRRQAKLVVFVHGNEIRCNERLAGRSVDAPRILRHPTRGNGHAVAAPHRELGDIARIHLPNIAGSERRQHQSGVSARARELHPDAELVRVRIGNCHGVVGGVNARRRDQEPGRATRSSEGTSNGFAGRDRVVAIGLGHLSEL
jgi:hypothetical protein